MGVGLIWAGDGRFWGRDRRSDESGGVWSGCVEILMKSRYTVRLCVREREDLSLCCWDCDMVPAVDREEGREILLCMILKCVVSFMHAGAATWRAHKCSA